MKKIINEYYKNIFLEKVENINTYFQAASISKRIL